MQGKPLQALLLLWPERGPGKQALIRGLSRVPLALHFVIDQLFLLQMQHGLEQVVVDPHPLIQRVYGFQLLWGIQTTIAQVLPYEGIIFLLHHPGVVFLLRPTPREGHPDHFLLTASATRVLVEELSAIIWRQFSYWERQAREHLSKARFHCALPSPHDCYPLTPAAGHIHQLQGVEIVAGGALAAMRHQIDRRLALGPVCPRECVPLALPWSADWLAPALCAVSALGGTDFCAGSAPPSNT